MGGALTNEQTVEPVLVLRGQVSAAWSVLIAPIKCGEMCKLESYSRQ